MSTLPHFEPDATADRLTLLRQRTETLLRIVHEVSGAGAVSLSRLGSALLALPPGLAAFPLSVADGRGSAALNPDGLPMEAAVTATFTRLAFRLVADPAAIFVSPALRLALARTALAEVLDLAGATAMRRLFDAAIRHTLPEDEEALSAYRDGPMCIAAAVGGRGAAIYLDARTAGDDGWQRAAAFAEEVLPRTDDALGLLNTLRSHCELASVGAEGSDEANAVVKFYFRLRAPMPLDVLGIDLLRHPSIPEFSSALTGGRSVPPSGLLISFGIGLSDGALRDVKINYCGHCLAYDPDTWYERLSRQTDALRLVAIPVRELLRGPSLDVSFVTCGLSVDGRSRINLYVRPVSGH